MFVQVDTRLKSQNLGRNLRIAWGPNAPAQDRTMAFGLHHRGDGRGLSKKRLWKHLGLQPHLTVRGPTPRRDLDNHTACLPILGWSHCSLPPAHPGPAFNGVGTVAGKAATARTGRDRRLKRAGRGPFLPVPTPAGSGALVFPAPKLAMAPQFTQPTSLTRPPAPNSLLPPSPSTLRSSPLANALYPL